MKTRTIDVMVIGGGAAGMAAALEIRAQGFNVLIAEREERLGGILLQCIHNGFGLIEFHEELTGPEYADIFIERVKSSNIEILLNTTVMTIKHGEGGIQVICLNGKDGHILFSCRAVGIGHGQQGTESGKFTDTRHTARRCIYGRVCPVPNKSGWLFTRKGSAYHRFGRYRTHYGPPDDLVGLQSSWSG